MEKIETKHLLGLENISKHDIEKIIDVGFTFREVLERPIKKVPVLNGKNIVNLFFENSTRTKISFELAEKRLSADVLNLNMKTSATTKGETLLDTVNPILVTLFFNVKLFDECLFNSCNIKDSVNFFFPF